MALIHCLIVIPTSSVSPPGAALSIAGNSARCPPIKSILYSSSAGPAGNSGELFQGVSQAQHLAEDEKTAFGGTAKGQLFRDPEGREFSMVAIKVVTQQALPGQIILFSTHTNTRTRSSHTQTTELQGS